MDTKLLYTDEFYTERALQQIEYIQQIVDGNCLYARKVKIVASAAGQYKYYLSKIKNRSSTLELRIASFQAFMVLHNWKID